jgi:hypothetical protein
MRSVLSLDEIGLRHGTDKSSVHHDYLRFYEEFLAPLRNAEVSILEIGVLNGASLRTWEDYFPNARIVGADISQAARRFGSDRIIIELADQSDIEELTGVAVRHGPFDIIVEDGSHMWEHQITSLRTLFPFLRNGGMYIVEDLQTNYGPMSADYRGVASFSCIEFLKSWLDLLVGDDQVSLERIEDAFLRSYGRAVQFIIFYRRACLIKKLRRSKDRSHPVGRPLVSEVPDAPHVEARLLAHLSYVGDIFNAGGFISSSSPDMSFQGFSIGCDEDVLEYRVRWNDDSWSEWSPTGSFAGTRWQSRTVHGFTVRLRELAKCDFRLRAWGQFTETESPIEVIDGQDCVSRSGGALYGLQIELTKGRRTCIPAASNTK